MKLQRHERYLKWPPVIEDDNTVKVPVFSRGGNFVMYTFIEFDDMELVLKEIYHRSKREVPNFPGQYYIRSSASMKNLHEIVMGGAKPGFKIDHHNGITHDNRRSNLNYVTVGQNNQNRVKRKGTSSQYIGVTWSKKRNKFVTRIQYMGHIFHLGEYKLEITAYWKYDYAAILFYGRDAKTNDPVEEHIKTDIINETKRDLYVELFFKDLIIPENFIKMEDGTYKRIDYDEDRNHSHISNEIVREYFIRSGKYKLVNRNEPIIRNLSGQAIIKVTSRKGLYSEIIVDDDLWHELSALSVVRTGKYAYICFNGKSALLHRYIVRRHEEIDKDKTIDHINVNEIDNRISNLRQATRSLQSHNKEKMPGTFDVYRCVDFMKMRFFVMFDKTSHASYDNAEEAAAHANELMYQKYGKDANLNIIDWSKKTTYLNRIDMSLLSREFIMNLKYLKDVRNIITVKDLGPTGEGVFPSLNSMKTRDVEKYKEMLADHLFPKDQNRLINLTFK